MAAARGSMEDGAQAKILELLDVISVEVAANRGETTALRDEICTGFNRVESGFMLFWETTAMSAGVPVLFQLWGIPFVGIGLYMVAGRFFAGAFVRSRTSYIVTDRAAYVAYAGPFPSVKRHAGRALAALEYQRGSSIYQWDLNPSKSSTISGMKIRVC